MWNLSSQTRDRTLAPTLKVWSLNSWTTREVFFLIFLGELFLISTLLTCYRCFYSSLSLKSAWLSSFWIKLPSQPSPWLLKSLPPLHFPQSRLLSLHTPSSRACISIHALHHFRCSGEDEGEKLCRQKEGPLGEGEERKVSNTEELILPSFPFPLLSFDVTFKTLRIHIKGKTIPSIIAGWSKYNLYLPILQFIYAYSTRLLLTHSYPCLLIDVFETFPV